MKINILDAGIRTRAGHHYDYGLKLLKFYTEGGHDVHVYGSADMDDEVAGDFQEFGPTTKLFRMFPYQPENTYDWYAGTIVRYCRESPRLAEDLRSVRQADLWIWPTLRSWEVDACASHGVDAPMIGCVYWDPGLESRSIDARLWRNALLFAQERGVQVTLASVESELRHRFMPIVANGRFALVPHPVGGPPIPKPKTALKRIGFFGHQREEKGLKMMKPLLSQLVQDGYAITFHNSDRGAESLDLPGVDMLRYAKDIAEPIAECDLVVLPYSVERYRARGSGILAECLALGIPVTAPVGTLPGRIIEQAGVGPLCVANSLVPIYQAIKATERNYASFAQNAYRYAQKFCARNGVAQFASALLAAAGPQSPPKIRRS